MVLYIVQRVQMVPCPVPVPVLLLGAFLNKTLLWGKTGTNVDTTAF